MDKDLQKVKEYLERRVKHSSGRVELLENSEGTRQYYAEGYWDGKRSAYENALDFINEMLKDTETK